MEILYLLSIAFLLSFYGVFGAYFIVTFFLSNQGKELKQQNFLPLIYGLFFGFLMIGRIILFYFDYFLTHLDPINYNLSNLIIWKIGVSFQMFGYWCLFILMEKRVLKGKDKYLLVIISIVLYVIGMGFQDIILSTRFIMFSLYTTVYIPIAYLIIAKKSEGRVRIKAVGIFIGFLLIFLGMYLLSENYVAILVDSGLMTRYEIHIITNFMKCIGLGLFFFGFKE